MPARSKVMTLPAEVRKRLDALLIERGFSGYAELADWLTDQGHPMSHMAVHRYGAKLERQIAKVRASTEMATALVEATPDDAGAMADAALRLVQDRMFEFLLEAEGDDLKALSNAAKAVAAAAHASARIRTERRKVLSETKKAVEKVARQKGLTTDTAAAIRAAIEGVEAAP